jgi:hypothetical protein
LRPSVAAGVGAVVSSTAYIASDLWELSIGGFSTPQLVLTYLAEATLPLFVLGLAAAQRPRLPGYGWAGAVLYAYTYVYFTGTVTLSLVERVPDWAALAERMGPWLTAHGALMVLAGVLFGAGVVRARVLPRWTGYALALGVCLVAAANWMPAEARVPAATVRAVAFIGMGVAAVRLPLLPHTAVDGEVIARDER